TPGSTIFPYTTLFRSGLGSGNQAVAFHGRSDRPGVAVEDNVFQLPNAGHLTPDPAGRTRGDVTLDAGNLGVRRVIVGNELRLHRSEEHTSELQSRSDL